MIVLVTEHPSGYRSVHTEITSIVQVDDRIDLHKNDDTFTVVWARQSSIEILPDGWPS